MKQETDTELGYCLDLSRLLSRVGRGQFTGVDRVELAYLRHLLGTDIPLFGLVKFGPFFFLVERSGMNALLALIEGQHSWGSPVLAARLLFGGRKLHQQIFSDLGRLSVKMTGKSRLQAMLGSILPAGVEYLNVGHSNISARVMQAVRNVNDSKISVMIHDAIPLDYPAYQRVGTPERFEQKLEIAGKFADRVIFNSHASKHAVDRHFQRLGFAPRSVVAHLGVTVPAPEPVSAHQMPDLKGPYFVSVGTIEPRKNHAMLLDIWDRFAKEDPVPTLVIAGARGWRNESVFARLDNQPRGVVELNNLSDRELAGLVARSTALLFPSVAEGFGLPAGEAALLNVPVVCSDIDVFKEFLGDYPVYADSGDMYQWETIIKEMAYRNVGRHDDRGEFGKPISIPTWNDHFNLVLKR